MKIIYLSIIVLAGLMTCSGCSINRRAKSSASATPSPATEQSSADNSAGTGHSETQPAATPNQSAPTPDEVHTPEMGSPERQAIMDALRGDQDVWFQVHFLKVHNGWCWADTTPLDKYGRATAEGGPNLLHFENDKWRVMDLSKVPDDPDDPLGAEDASPTYIRNVMKTFPGVPRDIFPKSNN